MGFQDLGTQFYGSLVYFLFTLLVLSFSEV